MVLREWQKRGLVENFKVGKVKINGYNIPKIEGFKVSETEV